MGERSERKGEKNRMGRKGGKEKLLRINYLYSGHSLKEKKSRDCKFLLSETIILLPNTRHPPKNRRMFFIKHDSF